MAKKLSASPNSESFVRMSASSQADGDSGEENGVPLWLRDALGNSVEGWTLEDRTREAGQAEVWLARRCGEFRVVRRPRHRPSLRSELESLRTWRDAVGPSVPSVLAVDSQAGWLVLEGRPGILAAELGPEDPRRKGVHEQVGVLRRRADTISCPHDPLSAQDAMLRRISATASRVRQAGWGHGGFLEVLEALESVNYAGLRRAACHRDLGEHNLLVDDDGRISLIDFGRAAPDFFLAELVPLHLQAWDGEHELRDAFERGYGEKLDPDARAQLARFAWLYALNTALWGTAHGEPTRTGLGTRWLAQQGPPVP